MPLLSRLFNKKEQTENLNIPDEKIDILMETEETQETEEVYEVLEREILPTKIICPDCGGITLEGLDFCDKCGGELF